MNKFSTSWHCGFAFLLATLWFSGVAHAQAVETPDDAVGVDEPMQRLDPRRAEAFAPYRIKHETTWPAGMAELWLKALRRPEVDIRLEAADAIGRASEQGMPGLEPAVAMLSELVSDANTPGLLRLAAAQALVRMDAAQAKDALLDANRTGDVAMVLMTDGWLFKQQPDLVSTLWLPRLLDRTLPVVVRVSIFDQRVKTALNGQSFQALLKLAAESSQPLAVRRAAARVIVDNGWSLNEAQRRAMSRTADALAEQPMPNPWLAAMLAAGAEDAVLLEQLADSNVSPVLAVALPALEREKPLTDAMIEHGFRVGDAAVRSELVKLLAERFSPQAVVFFADRLGDPDPQVRRAAANGLFEGTRHARASRSEIQAAVEENAMQQLASTDWRRLQEAALLLGAMQHKPAESRLRELLAHPRAEVRLAAIVGLRRLNQPSAWPVLLRHAQQWTEQVKTLRVPSEREPLNRQLSQTFQTFGVVGFDDSQAMQLMESFINAKGTHAAEPRAAAIWAIGMLRQGKPDRGLIRQLNRRIGDVNLMNPEADEVRSMSAIAIGQMRPNQVPANVRQYAGEEADMNSDRIAEACLWALTQIPEGNPKPWPVLKNESRQWFLTPVR